MFSRSLMGVVSRHSMTVTAKHLVHCPRLTAAQTPLQLASSPLLVRGIHLTAKRWDEEEKEGKAKARLKARKKAKIRKEAEKKSLDEELMSATVEAAKSLPGDWTRTADDLMSRLAVHDGKESVMATEASEEKTEPLLATMRVERGFERQKSQPHGQSSDESLASGLDDSVVRSRTGRIRSRAPETFTKVYSQPSLGIFDPKTFTEDPVEGEKDLWHEKDLDDIRRARGHLPSNAFEEMIQLTKAGQMWTYPVDNEADMHEERKYKFHQHIFLERHLDQFPSQGPLRRFIDLVVLGLSKNPWVTVPEKEEHIRWFVNYFREKRNLLEPTLGDQAHMKDVEAEGEKV